MDSADNNQSVDQEVMAESKMDVPGDKAEAPDDSVVNEIDANKIQPIPTETSQQSNSTKEKPRDGKPMPLDKFKRRLVRAVARQIQQKKPEAEMWQELKKEIGCDCEMLWQHMRALTLKKLKRLLPANDLLVNLKKIARLTATDWLLFDLILVHEKVNVISVNDTENADDEYKEEPQCLHDLFELIKEHRVENLSGDDLTEAWIRVTLNYNSRGRQCSPMLLQLRWYQLKELTRARFYNFWCAYRGNHKILDRAMKVKPTELQTEIAREYKQIITHTYPEWEKLIEDRRVILSEEFTMNREAKRKKEEAPEGNDAEIEVIEPLVETIELEVDSEEEQVNNCEKKMNTENSDVVEDYNKKSEPDPDVHKILVTNTSNSVSPVKSDSEDDVLELDGLSDVEATYIPLESQKTYFGKGSEDSCRAIIKSDIKEMLPKITNVIGNIVEPIEITNIQEIKILAQNNAAIDVKGAISETIINVNQSTETKNTNIMQCDSDDEIDTILREKVNNLMNIEITQIKSEYDNENVTTAVVGDTKNYEKLQDKEEFHSVNDASCSSNKLVICDSDEDVDKVLQEKTSNYLGIRTPQTNVAIIDEAPCANLNISDNSIDNNQVENIHTNQETEEDAVAKEEGIVKKEKHDDGFDEVEFDDDQIEFVDDGIEFVEEMEGDKKKTNYLKIDPSSDSEEENTTKIDDYPKIDLKLLMNPIVYTKKLDVMSIFKLTDFIYVNDKNIIDCAILESKPVDKMALNDEDIKKFREQAISGYETDVTQSVSNTEQTAAMEYESNRVKCTSWLLQKPKNRRYNPIQLCKNPDFNTRLKRLTAGFLSSTRNRVLLKECKPMTIDLHKAFEKKLINGTMYLKGGDFKSAKCKETDNINNEPVTVLPSAIPGQSMVFTTNITNDISAEISNKLDNRENNSPLSPIVEKYVPSERRKVINLPDIDQVRRVNQSLLTAEVTPIRIESKIHNSDSCKEPYKPPAAEQVAFVQPIALAPITQIKNEPITQIKNEPLEFVVDNKNKIESQPHKIEYDSSSRKEMIANKINDQIINLSNQISEVDNNELLSIHVEKTVQKQCQLTKKLGRKPQDNAGKRKIPQHVNKLTYIPRYRGQLTWSPKYPKNHIADSLLTLDTLSKILFLLNGNEEEIKKCSSKQKRFLKEIPQLNKSIKEQRTKQFQSTLPGCNNSLKISTANEVIKTNAKSTQGSQKKKNGKPRNIKKKGRYNGIYCCWAREKIVSIFKKKKVNIGKHRCNVRNCQCCCRQELVTITILKCSDAPAKDSKKISSTIVLSDDEDPSKGTENNKNTVMVSNVQSLDKTVTDSINLVNDPITSNVNHLTNEQSDKDSIKIVIPITNVAIHTDSTNSNVKSIVITSEKPVENMSSDTNVVENLSEKEELLKKQKSCKTTVHAAERQAHNKRVEIIENNHKRQNSTSFGFTKSIGTLNQDTTKHIERTLILNSSQIVDKPTRTPIFLGKNKILLCSLKNSRITAPPVNLPVLPYGVHFVMLPNGELTLSIDNGAQLDSEQLSAMPALMSMVQEQFLKSNISSKNTNNDNTLEENDDVSIIEENNILKQTITNVESCTDSLKDNHDKSRQSDYSFTSEKNDSPDGKNVQVKLSDSKLSDLKDDSVSRIINTEKETSTQNTDRSEDSSVVAEGKKNIEEYEMTATEVNKQTANIQKAVENKLNIPTTESFHTPDEQCRKDNNDIRENKNMHTRKTILSDLMEMSGISAEDTSMASDVTNFCPPFTALPPTIIPVTRTSASGIDMFNVAANCNVTENISIMGAYSNLLSFEPTTPTNRLLNCIAHIRPELNAVTSFVELKYVYENNGMFYKLDIDTGIISEIKVFIKKNPTSNISTTPKDFIDLTDDPCDNENVVTCAEFQDIPQGKQDNAEVKPIKLFKAIHPTILKRSGRSILKENEVLFPKKPIRINKQRRKQLLNISDKYVLVSIGDEKDATALDEPLEDNLDSSYDSSDDEPLAKKFKRIKSTDNNVQETPIFVEAPEPQVSVPDELVDIPDITDMSGDCGDTSDLEMNTMDIEGVNPELHPVAFEEGSESEEDMCILGV